MFKFLRKYNKWILAVGGTLLLIVFLIPQAIQGLSQRAAVSGASRATVGDGEEVSVREWLQVQEEIQFLDRVGAGLPGLGLLELPEHWYLLVREADQAGLVGGPSTVPIAPEDLAALSGSLGKRPAFIVGTQAKLSGVGRLLGLYQTAGKFSDRRLRTSAQRLFHAVRAQLVVIEASDADSDLEPTEAELEAQLAEFADVVPGEGEMGFGYRLPDRVKIEWLEVSADAVRAMLEASDALSGVELRRHWRLNESRPEYPAVEPGAEVPDVVREGLLSQLTAERLDDLARAAGRQLQNRRRSLSQDGGWLILPDDWAGQRMSFTDLAAWMQAESAVESPAYQAIGDRWLALDEVADLEGVGVATTDKLGPRPLGLADILPGLKEFQASTAIVTQAGVTGPTLRGADGSVFFWRVTDVDAARPPASVDEVRDELVRDLRRKQRFETLRAEADAIAGQARRDGLLATALDHDTIVQRTTATSLCNQSLLLAQMNAGFQPTALPTSLPVIGPDEATVEAIVTRALALGADTDLSTVDETERTFVLPVEDKLSLLVVRLLDQTPLAQQTFVNLVNAGALDALMLRDEMEGDEKLREAFGYDALAARHQFAIARGEADPDADPDAVHAVPDEASDAPEG